MNRTEFKVKLVLLGKTNRDVIRELKERGITVDECRFSKAIGEVVTHPFERRVKSEAEKIVTEWEAQAKGA